MHPPVSSVKHPPGLAGAGPCARPWRACRWPRAWPPGTACVTSCTTATSCASTSRSSGASTPSAPPAPGPSGPGCAGAAPGRQAPGWPRAVAELLGWPGAAPWPAAAACPPRPPPGAPPGAWVPRPAAAPPGPLPEPAAGARAASPASPPGSNTCSWTPCRPPDTVHGQHGRRWCARASGHLRTAPRLIGACSPLLVRNV